MKPECCVNLIMIMNINGTIQHDCVHFSSHLSLQWGKGANECMVDTKE